MATASTICVYPLSPSYLVLHRYLYYLSLTLSVLYPTPPPLIKGAFAFSLTYSSTAALYAILILALPLPSSTPIINLDVLGLWAVLAPAAILTLPLLTWSRNLQGAHGKSARPIIRIWAVVVLIGTACAFVLLQTAQQTATRSLDAGGAAAAAPPLDCQALAAVAAADAARGGRHLRDPDHVRGVAYDLIFPPLFRVVARRLVPLTFIPLAFGSLAGLVTIDAAPSAPAEWEGGVEVSSSDGVGASPRRVFLLLRRVVLYLTAAWLLPVLVVNELYLMRDWPTGVPEAEGMYEVGQWGLFAGLGLVSAAALVSWVASGAGKEDRDGDGEEQYIS